MTETNKSPVTQSTPETSSAPEKTRRSPFGRRQALGLVGLVLASIPLDIRMYDIASEAAAEEGKTISYGQYVKDYMEAMNLKQQHRHKYIDKTTMRALVAGEDGKWHAKEQGVNDALGAARALGFMLALPSRRQRKKDR